STHTWRPPRPPSRTEETTPSVALTTSVPRLAKMSTPSWERSAPRGAPKVSATARASTPATGIATARGAGRRESSHSVRGLSMKGWRHAQSATTAIAASTISQVSRRSSARMSAALQFALQPLAQLVVELELARKLVEVGTLHEALLVGGKQAGQVQDRKST